MKRLLLLIVIMCPFLLPLSAQRYLPGQQGLQLTGGTTDCYGLVRHRNVGFYIGIARSSYTQAANRWVYGVEYLNRHYCYKHTPMPVVQFTADGGYYYQFLSNPGKDVFLSVGGLLMTGYETSNWGKKKLPDGATLLDKDGFLYGGAVAFEMEAFITDRLVLLLNIKERLLFGSSVGKFHFQSGIGVKYIIR
ncbi:MAG: conjugal transfer protein TraO [Odoribacter sp.]|nr:conjugal transfer protein TraO [Odoribacter sp.]